LAFGNIIDVDIDLDLDICIGWGILRSALVGISGHHHG
jgi:hypothetical protein